jgi:hypothetical protein
MTERKCRRHKKKGNIDRNAKKEQEKKIIYKRQEGQ